MPDEIFGVMAVKNGQKQTIMNLSNARQKSYADLQNMTDAQKKGVIICPDYPKEEFLVTADEVSYGSGSVKDALDELTTIGENLLTQNLTINHQTDATLPIAEPLELNHLYVMSYNGIQGYNDSVLFMISGGNTVSISCMSSIYTNSPMRFFLNRTSKGIYWSLLSGTTTGTITITSIRKII